MSSFLAVKKNVNTGEVAGFYDPQFERVAEEFVRNFQERGEVGAAVSIIIEGEKVVDLWGGSADPASNKPWVEDTIALVWSATKGATALCAHMLADRGLLDLDAPVVRYWPEFGQAGKEAIPVKMLLNHQSGLPEALENRVAFMIPAPPPGPEGLMPPMFVAMADPTSLQTLVMFNSGGHMLPGPDGVFGFNVQAAHAAEIGAAGGISNARGLAGMYAPLANGGSLNGVRLVGRESLARIGSRLLGQRLRRNGAGPYTLLAGLCQINRQSSRTFVYRKRQRDSLRRGLRTLRIWRSAWVCRPGSQDVFRVRYEQDGPGIGTERARPEPGGCCVPFPGLHFQCWWKLDKIAAARQGG